MSKMSDLALELEELKEEAWDRAMELESTLSKIANLLWQNGDLEPCLRAPRDLLAMLATIQTELAAPMEEIEGAV